MMILICSLLFVLIVLIISHFRYKSYLKSLVNINNKDSPIVISVSALHTDELLDMLRNNDLSENDKKIVLKNLEKRDYKVYLQEIKRTECQQDQKEV
jgi:aspartokinase